MKNRGICRRGTDVFVHFTIIELDGYGRPITASKTEMYQTTPRIPGSFLFLKTPLLQRVGVLWFPSVTHLEVLQSCWLLFYRRQGQPTATHTYEALLIMTEAFLPAVHAWCTQVCLLLWFAVPTSLSAESPGLLSPPHASLLPTLSGSLHMFSFFQGPPMPQPRVQTSLPSTLVPHGGIC